MKLQTYISAGKIQEKVAELASVIDNYLGDSEAVMIANLKGSVIFFSDLIRAMKSRNITTDFLSTESYAGTEHTGTVKITRDLSMDIAGKKVVLVEDILDTGLTLSHIMRYIRDIHQPADVKICVLLDKPANRKVELSADFVGFTIKNEFVVGYGLDYYEKLRNLPYIAWVEEE
ncbi:MAG: hypoxanthine phosphoribosyltransferase [Spirochaetes bacterium GWF1_51_8]|nr:MAG: hypoxanthine phosphoribosyltransferase [Spirochaetes bacterium GWF1_51_8]